MEHYYGQSGSNAQYKNRPQIYLFNSEDLDNEDIIMQVENTPTCKRTRQQLEELRRLSHGPKEVTEEAIADASAAPGIIRFE
jgi:cell division protein FtsZ